MIKAFLLAVFPIVFGIVSIAQSGTKPNYHWPLGIDPVLAANFGELRPNHFHMGIDFKTNGKIGYNIYSIEDGYVSRIKVSTYGYGKVIYIDHPNGITSVYAHCSEFKGEIDSLVKRTQQAEENFEIEIFPENDELKVKKGQVVAISGNTGGSSAPHLHFELRDTKTEHALNPLLYGFDIADHKAPEIRNLKIYGLTDEGYRRPNKSVRYSTVKSGSDYIVSAGLIALPTSYFSSTGGIGFAFDVIDRFDAASNQCGLFASALIIDGDTLFGQRTARIPFESTRYVNCHKDYEEYSAYKRKFHKSYRTQENDLPIYTVDGLGIYKGNPNLTHKAEYIAWDVKGNKSVLKFEFKIAENSNNSNTSDFQGNQFIHPSEGKEIANGNTIVEFGLGTVYEPMKVKSESIQSTIGDREIPVHNAYRIRIKNSEPQDGKHYIEMITASGKKKALSVIYDKDEIICDSKYFGSYQLKRDVTPPSITPISFTSATTSYSRSTLKWKISDSEIGIEDYDLFIDGKWALLEYEYKDGTITHTFDPHLKGEHEFKLIVKDGCNNSANWSGKMNIL